MPSQWANGDTAQTEQLPPTADTRQAERLPGHAGEERGDAVAGGRSLLFLAMS
jgi:hypothetical protein